MKRIIAVALLTTCAAVLVNACYDKADDAAIQAAYDNLEAARASYEVAKSQVDEAWLVLYATVGTVGTEAHEHSRKAAEANLGVANDNLNAAYAAYSTANDAYKAALAAAR